MLHSHDTGKYIAPYGYQVDTPHLSQLAREGTLFRQAYCAGPTCSPSRAAMLTGMCAHSTGMLGLAHRGFALNDHGRHMANFLRTQGYETVLCGIQHEADQAEKLGYSRILRAEKGEQQGCGFATSDRMNAEAAAAYIRDTGAVLDKPFFLFCGLFLPHRPFVETYPEEGNYVLLPPSIADTAENRADMAGYMSSAAWMDRCVGIVLNAVKAAGLEEDTLIVYTTDHGIAFPGMKCSLEDSGIGVSLIVKAPGNQRQGQVCDMLVSHLDLFPTVCDIAGVEPPEWLQGVSLLPVLRGSMDKEVNTFVFAEVNYHAAYEPMRCVRTKQHKLIRLYDDDPRPVLANIDDAPSKDFLLQHGFLSEIRPLEMLFDLYLDPMERVNRIGDPRYKAVHQSLSEALDEWMKETNDPLLSGKVTMPEGAVVNTRDSVSPLTEDYE